MNDKDEKWFNSSYLKDELDWIAESAWQAACEYKQGEIDELKDQIDHQDSLIFELDQNVQVFMEKTKALQAENAKLRECVEFYADEMKWGQMNNYDLGTVVFMQLSEDTELWDDDYFIGGKRARQVLKELENKKDDK